jgi:hypothetical protein
MPGENASDAEFSTQEEVHRPVNEIVDEIRVGISDRFSQLREL